MTPRREFVPIAKMAGKTIARACHFEKPGYIVLIYTDGSYTATSDNSNLNPCPINYYYDDCFTDEQFIEMGFYTAEDIAEHRRKIDEDRTAQQREADLREFERLKKKLGVTG